MSGMNEASDMPGPAPSPFPARTWPTSLTYLYVDGVDLTPWADRASLQAATMQFAQGVAETMTITLHNRAPDNSPMPTLPPQMLPVIRAGIVPVMYIERFGSGTEDYVAIFSGTVDKLTITDTSWDGETVLEVSTPMKALKEVLRAVRFFQQTTANDVERIRALGHKWDNPNFDFSLSLLGNTGTPNVTYLPPTIYFDGQYWVYNEPDKTYEDKSVFDILMDICTDPGSPPDTGYPVPNRPFWFEGRFKDGADPTQGVTWVLVMRAVRDVGTATLNLTDDPTDGDLPYMAGAQLAVDYSTVIRRVNVAGRMPYQAPGPDTFSASGSTDPLALFAPSAGWVRKIGGVDGDWDCTGTSAYTSYFDFDFAFQIQETYLAHDPFRGDDVEILGPTSMFSFSDPSFPIGTWIPAYIQTDEALRNSMARRNQRATPNKPVNSAFTLLDAVCATCIVRAHIDHNVDGATIICRATQDVNEMWTSGIALVKHGATYDLCTFDGTSLSVLATSTHVAIDNELVKINCKYNEIQVFFNDVIDPALTTTTTYNAHATLFGIGCFDIYGGLWYQTTFADFSVTEFWGDKAIGIGSAESGTDWSWIGYGYVFNTNGTYTLVQGGLIQGTLGCTPPGTQADVDAEYAALDAYQAAHGGHLPPGVPYLWADVLLAHNTLGTGFSYDDVFQLTTVLYQDTDGSTKRKVQYWKQPGGSGEFILLAEQLGIAGDIIHANNPPALPVVWYHQVALKELGATFSNISSSTNYNNVFLPPASLLATLVELEGDYPATGTVQGDQLNTYALREKIAHAVFQEWGNPIINFQCTVYMPSAMLALDKPYPYERGDMVKVKCRRAGWNNPLGGPDTRPTLMVRTIQRVPDGAGGRNPKFLLTVGNPYYDLSDPARSHLLKPGADVFVPATLGIPELTGMSYFFADPISTDDHFGQYIEIQVRALGEAADGNYPIYKFPASDRKVQLPPGTFPPGVQFESRHRTVSHAGTPTPWSTWYPGTAPAGQAYDRPYTINFPFGDGINALAPPLDATGEVELQVNEAAAITSWALTLNKPGSVTLDISYASDADRRDIGVTAYASIVGLTGVKPYTLYSRGDGTANTGTDLGGWDAKRSNLKKGDWLRVIVTTVDAANTTATLGTLSLTCQRIGLPTLHAGGG